MDKKCVSCGHVLPDEWFQMDRQVCKYCERAAAVHRAGPGRLLAEAKHLAAVMNELRGLQEARAPLAEFQRVVNTTPRYAHGWKLLGMEFARAGDVRGKADAYKKVVELDPGDAAAWNTLSCVYTAGGKLHDGLDASQKERVVAEALAHARKAIELAPGKAVYRTTLGEALEASGDVDGAVAAYKEALAIDPGEKYARDYLQRLGVAAGPAREAMDDAGEPGDEAAWEGDDDEGVDGDEFDDASDWIGGRAIFVDDESFRPTKATLYTVTRVLGEVGILASKGMARLRAQIDAIEEDWSYDFGGTVWSEFRYPRKPYFDAAIECPYTLGYEDSFPFFDKNCPSLEGTGSRPRYVQSMVVYESLKLLDPMNYRYHTRFIIAQSSGYVPESRLRGEATIQALLDKLAAALHLPRGKLVAGSFGW